MASTPIIDLRPRSVGEILDLTFLLYRRNFLRLIGIALVVLGPMLALTLLSSTGSLIQYATTLSDIAQGTQGDSGAGMTAVLSTAIATCAGGLSLLVGIFVPWMEGALMYNIIERVLGRQPNWRASYSAVRPRWGSLWVANAIRVIAVSAALIPFVLGLYGVLIGLLVTVGSVYGNRLGNNGDASLFLLGMMAICLPIGLLGGGIAIFLTSSWSMTIPAIVGEGVDGASSLGRSNSLVTGYRMRMIGRLLLFEVMRFFVLTLPILAIELFIIGGSATAVTTGDQSPLGIAGIIAASLLSSLENILIVPFYMVFITVNYLDLRVRKENLDLQIQAANLALAGVDLPPAQRLLNTGAVTDMTNPIGVSSNAAKMMVSSPLADAAGMAVITQQSHPKEVVTDGGAVDAQAAASMPAASSGTNYTAVPTPAQRISALFKRLRTEGQNPELLNELGLAYQEVGDLFGAQDSFTRARTLAPDNPDYAYNMALLQKDRRDLPAARHAIADYLRLETNADKRQKVLANSSLQDLLP